MMCCARSEREAEPSVRRRDLDPRARHEPLVRPRREAAAADAFDRDAQLPVVRARADRIRAPQLFAVRCGPQREKLAVREREALAQVGRNLEGDDDRIAGVAANGRDRQRMKAARFSDT